MARHGDIIATLEMKIEGLGVWGHYGLQNEVLVLKWQSKQRKDGHKYLSRILPSGTHSSICSAVTLESD